MEAQIGKLIVDCKTKEEKPVRLFEELNMTGKAVNGVGSLTGGWLRAHPKEGFWQDWSPDLQREETKEAGKNS